MNENQLAMLIPIAAIVSPFVFVIFVVWFGTRRKEREAFYRSENLRRITEASGEGAKAAIDLLKEEERLKRIKAREGMKIGGLINVGLGIGLMIFLRVLLGGASVPGTEFLNGGMGGVYLCGLIPGLIGAALLVYVYFLAGPVE
jgi:hypothetical protein